MTAQVDRYSLGEWTELDECFSYVKLIVRQSFCTASVIFSDIHSVAFDTS